MGKWFQEFSERLGTRLYWDRETLEENNRRYSRFTGMMEKHISPGSRLLETGCGPGKLAAAAASVGFNVTAIDVDEKLLKVARKNFSEFNLKIKTIKLDLRNTLTYFGENSFDAVTHGGVLEHFPEKEMKNILGEQLKIAPKVFFYVPIETEHNKKRFSKRKPVDLKILWKKEKWIEFLKEFSVLEFFEERQTMDVLVVALGRQPKVFYTTKPNLISCSKNSADSAPTTSSLLR